MEQNKKQFDIVNEVLEDCLQSLHHSSFVLSLYKQYQERGSLSKKQLQGLHSKATDSGKIAPAKLATLEALIKKMPTRFKSDKPENEPLYHKDEETGKMIDAILAKYPQHKRVLYLKMKYDRNETIAGNDLTELKTFYRNLIKT